MLKRKIFAFIAVCCQASVFFGATVSYGMDGCDAVLEIAARETIRTYDYNQVTTEYYNSLCASSSQVKSSSKGGKAFIPTKFGLVGFGYTQADSSDAWKTKCEYRSYKGNKVEEHKKYLSLVNPEAIRAWSQCKENGASKAKITADELAGGLLEVYILPHIVGKENKATIHIIASGFRDGDEVGCRVQLAVGPYSDPNNIHSFEVEAGEQIALLCQREKKPTIKTPIGSSLEGGYKKADLKIRVDGQNHKIRLPESPQLEIFPNTKATVSCTFQGGGCSNSHGNWYTSTTPFNFNTRTMTFAQLSGQKFINVGQTPGFMPQCKNGDFSVWGRTLIVNGELSFELLSKNGLSELKKFEGKTKEIKLIPANKGLKVESWEARANPNSFGRATCTVTDIEIDKR